MFFFNLRSYDRLNFTPAMEEQEKKSGVRYQEVQRANAEEIMDEGVHGVRHGERGEDTSSESGYGSDSGDEERERTVDKKRRWEQERKAVGLDKEKNSEDSIAKDAMLNERKVVDEPWDEGIPEHMEREKDRFVQEELYIHGKILIVDDRTVICGSSNINDRVSPPIGYRPSLPHPQPRSYGKAN